MILDWPSSSTLSVLHIELNAEPYLPTPETVGSVQELDRCDVGVRSGVLAALKVGACLAAQEQLQDFHISANGSRLEDSSIFTS